LAYTKKLYKLSRPIYLVLEGWEEKLVPWRRDLFLQNPFFQLKTALFLIIENHGGEKTYI